MEIEEDNPRVEGADERGNRPATAENEALQQSTSRIVPYHERNDTELVAFRQSLPLDLPKNQVKRAVRDFKVKRSRTRLRKEKKEQKRKHEEEVLHLVLLLCLGIEMALQESRTW